MKYTKAFTLVELLVVISIIGMLSSVVLVSLQGARDKGRVGGGLKFATNNYHAFGADAIVVWNFNETGGNAKDQSGNNRDLTTDNNPLTRSAGGPTGSGYSLLVNQDDSEATYVFSTAKTTKTATVSFWIKFPTLPTSPGNIAYVADLSYYGGLPINVYYNTSSGFTCDSYGSTQVVLGQPRVGQWHHIACSLSATKLIGYFDGRQTGTPVTPMAAPDSVNGHHIDTVSVGGDSWNCMYDCNTAIGDMFFDDFSVYSSALASADIERIFASGVQAHLLAQK